MKTLLAIILAIAPSCLPAQMKRTIADNPVLQQWLQEQEQQLEHFFGVDATLEWYNDSDGMNAVAIPDKSTIMVGVRLMRYHLLKTGRGFRSLEAILAHEYGHLAQERFPNSLSFAYRELHADLLAGYYLGRSGLVDATGFWIYANATFETGDYNAGSFSHHGTPSERLACLMAGFKLAYLPLEDAFRVGAEFVETNF